MEIRKATEKDLPEIAKIFRIESSKAPYNKKRKSKKALEGIKKDFKTNKIYIAIIDNKVVGFVMAVIDSGIKNQLWINEIWVVEKYQGRGVGKKLMAEVERIYKRKGVTVFELVADTRKGGAVDFYKKINYKIDSSMVFMKKIK